MKARPSLVLGSNQAVLYEPWPNVIFHELASRNWPLAFQLEAWEHPIRGPSVGRFPVPIAQELCDALDHRHGLAALFALAVSHIAVEPGFIAPRPETAAETVWVLGASNPLWLTISFVRNPNRSASANCKTGYKKVLSSACARSARL